MLINCYYCGPHRHTFLPRHLDWDLEKMAALGTDIVSISMTEPYCPRSQLTAHLKYRVRHLIDRIHRHGLKVHAVPDRWGMIVAGWTDGVPHWMLQNIDTLVQRGDPEVKSDLTCDPASPKFEEHFRTNVHELVTEYDFDGLVWDEPRPPTADVAMFLDEMSAYAKSLRPGIVISLFAEAGTLRFAHDLARTQHIDYLGADGHLRSEDHTMFRMKNTIFTTHAHFTPILKKAGKKTFFLIEGQRHRDEDLDNYLDHVERAFSLPMDQLMYYYSAHEMSAENGQRMTDETWKQVARLAQSAKASNPEAVSQ